MLLPHALVCEQINLTLIREVKHIIRQIELFHGGHLDKGLSFQDTAAINLLGLSSTYCDRAFPMNQQVQKQHSDCDPNRTEPTFASLETPELTQLLLAKIAALSNKLWLTWPKIALS